MRILGLDPGYAICGYGIIESENQSLKILDYGTFSTLAGTPFEDRLLAIYEGVTEIIQEFQPDVVALEELFFGRNIPTALGTAQARGVLILAASKANLPIFEYKPMQVKKSVTGEGSADKRQVQEMIRVLLQLESLPKPDDAADALAVAICQAHTGLSAAFRLKAGYQEKGQKKSWRQLSNKTIKNALKKS